MGRFVYGSADNSFEIEDRALAHLRVVIMTKLRRDEPFVFEMNVGDGRRSFWISAAIPVSLYFHGSRSPELNRQWIETMMASANHGVLQIGREPDTRVVRDALSHG